MTKAHQELFRLAPIDEWKIPQEADGRPMRKAAYVVPPETQTETSQDEYLELEPDPQPINESLSSSDEESSDNGALSKLAKRYRKERDDWSSEDGIPLMELSKRIKLRDGFKPETDEQVSRDEPSFSDDEHYNSDSTMSVNARNLKHLKSSVVAQLRNTVCLKQCRNYLRHWRKIINALRYSG